MFENLSLLTQLVKPSLIMVMVQLEYYMLQTINIQAKNY